MSKNNKLFLFGILIIVAVVLGACTGETGAVGPEGDSGPTGPTGGQGPAGEAPIAADMSCTDCHNDTTIITGVKTAWEHSLHGIGESYDYAGGRASCTGCHSGGGFSDRIAAGVGIEEVELGDPNPTRQDCRACHQIHTTYTGDDFALETTDPVELMAFEGQTFDGGSGNLCVECHQPRRAFPAAVDGLVEVTSTHWGPHHGPQSAMLLGLAGGGVEGKPSKHADVEDTCVGCHMGAEDDHSFEPSTAACLECHDDVENFDLDGVQTEVKEKAEELEKLLISAGWLDDEGHPAVTSIPEDQAAALWDWIYIVHEDKSMGVHNPGYTLDLLDAGLEAMK